MSKIINTVTPQNSLEKFWEYCGISEQQRRYGKFEISGKVVNFYYNRFLKNISSNGDNEYSSDKEKDATASTREAFYVAYDKNTTSYNDRDDAIARRLPDGKDTKFRAKKIKYGNYNAMWEVLSGHLYSLTGLEAPDTRMMLCEPHNANKTPDIYVASPLITGYYDLGDFLVDEKIISSFISAEQMPIWQKEKGKIDKINSKSKSLDGISGEDKISRINSMSLIYELLPDYVHQEIEKSFAASKFIGNWDFANFNLNNIGVKFSFDKDRNVISFNSVFVDFGNSGLIGFGGQIKEQSFERANTEAKQYHPDSQDYDPALKFSATEIALITQAEEKIAPQIINSAIPEHKRKLAILAISQELSTAATSNNVALSIEDLELRRSIIFKTSHHIRTQETTLETDPLIGLLTISDLPRNLPFAMLFKPALKKKTDRALDRIHDHLLNLDSTNPEPEEAFDIKLPLESLRTKKNPFGLAEAIFLDSEIEMAFRLSLITDSSIEQVVNEWYLYDEFPEIFSSKNREACETATAIADLFKQRRDHLVASIPTEVVNQWVTSNKCQALAAQEEVNLAILKETRRADPEFEIKYPFADTGGNDSSRNKMAPSSPPRKFASRSSLNSQSRDFSFASLSSSPSSDENQPANDCPTKYCVINIDQTVAARIAQLSPIQQNNSNNFELGNIKIIITHLERFQPQQNQNMALISALENSLSSTQDIGSREAIAKIIREKKTEQEQHKTNEQINFISENIEIWRNSLGLDTKPNCNFLSIDLKRKTYHTQTYDDLSVASDQFLFSKESQERNAKLHQENLFVYSSFVDNLKSLTGNSPGISITSASSVSMVPESQNII